MFFLSLIKIKFQGMHLVSYSWSEDMAGTSIDRHLNPTWNWLEEESLLKENQSAVIQKKGQIDAR